MARPLKQGLDYFPVDIDMDQDDKIYMIEAELGELAFGRLMKLLMEIYRGGYFKRWGEEEELVFSGKKGFPVEEIRRLVACAIRRGFFDAGLYEAHGILTSAGIQKRYVQACENRKRIVLQEQYCLVDPEDFKDKITVRLVIVSSDGAESEPPSDDPGEDVIPEETLQGETGEGVNSDITPIIPESIPQKRTEETRTEERETPAHILFALNWYRRYNVVTASMVRPSGKDNSAALELFARIDARASPLDDVLDFYFWPGLEHWWAVDQKTKKRTYNFRAFCTNWTTILGDMQAASKKPAKRRRLCPHCKAEVPGTMQFCAACGEEFDEPKWEEAS